MEAPTLTAYTGTLERAARRVIGRSAAPRSADGYFPPGSMLRRVHGEHAVGLNYGQRALAIGALHPVNFVGTYESSSGRAEPFKRLVRTAKAFETIFFGSRAEADRVLAAVDRLHERVRGTLPEQAGPFPAGTPYSADAPELMLWTVAVIADSGRRIYELLVGALDPDERERLWQDYVRFGELFGMPRSAAPASYPEFQEWFDGMLASETMHLTDHARYIGHAIAFQIPVPRTHAPAMRLHNFVMLGSLPQPVREHYGLRWTGAQERALQAFARASRAARRVTPAALARGWNTPAFELVRRTEQRRIERGLPTPRILD